MQRGTCIQLKAKSLCPFHHMQDAAILLTGLSDPHVGTVGIREEGFLDGPSFIPSSSARWWLPWAGCAARWLSLPCSSALQEVCLQGANYTRRHSGFPDLLGPRYTLQACLSKMVNAETALTSSWLPTAHSRTVERKLVISHCV